MSGLPTMLLLIFAVILVVTIIIMTVVYLKQKTLSEIRTDAHQLILAAETMYMHGQNKEKLQYVFRHIRRIIPMPFNLLISDDALYAIIEYWFRSVKDLLDDGKINKSGGD